MAEYPYEAYYSSNTWPNYWQGATVYGSGASGSGYVQLTPMDCTGPLVPTSPYEERTTYALPPCQYSGAAAAGPPPPYTPTAGAHEPVYGAGWQRAAYSPVPLRVDISDESAAGGGAHSTVTLGAASPPAWGLSDVECKKLAVLQREKADFRCRTAGAKRGSVRPPRAAEAPESKGENNKNKNKNNKEEAKRAHKRHYYAFLMLKTMVHPCARCGPMYAEVLRDLGALKL